MNHILKSYQKRLTNLTGKNKSVLLFRIPGSHFIDIHKFNFLNKKPSFSIIENLVLKKTATLCPEFDSRDQDVNLLSRNLKKLLRTDKFLFEEQGTRDLHIGWPFIRGKFSDGTPVRAALTFIPVELLLNNGNWELHTRSDIGISLNKSFLLSYGHYNEVRIPDELLEFSLESFDNDLTVFRTSLYQLFNDSTIEFNFNRDNFMDELTSFTEFNKKEFDEDHKAGELKLYPEAVLGIFPQSGSNLVPDYDKLLTSSYFEDLNDFFEKRTLSGEDLKHSPYYFLGQVSEEKTFTPFPIDAHQENAIKALKKGYSIVVQGPPGTGKSQLICNLMADYMARGKNVLVVCQKRAALDVVHDRLAEKNMTDFIGLVHDFKSDRKQIYEKIARQIRRIPDYQNQNNSLDLVQLERRFRTVSIRIDQIAEELEEYKTALFRDDECGLSVKELYLTSSFNDPTINLKLEYRNFNFNTVEEFLVKLREYTQYGSLFNRTDYPLRDRKSFKGYGISELKKMEGILEELPLLQKEIAEKTTELFGIPIKIEEGQSILSKQATITEMLNLLNDDKVFSFFQNMAEFSDKETNLLWLTNNERVLLDCYKGEGPEISLPSHQLGKFQETLERSLEARKGLVKFVKWKLFSEDNHYINDVLIANGLPKNKEGIRILVDKIDSRLNLEHNLSKLKEKKWLSDIPKTFEKIGFQNWFHLKKEAIKAKLIFNSLRQFREYFNVSKLTYTDLKNTLEALFKILYEIPKREEIWLLYFSKNQISNILNFPALADTIRETLKKNFDALCEFDNLKEQLLPYEREVIDRAIDEAGTDDIGAIEELFVNSLKIAWIDHIEAKYPVLRYVSSLKLKKMETEFQNLVIEKLDICSEILMLKAREKTYETIEYNRLNNRVTYRDLDHQVNKKKRIWPMRKLIENHHEEIFKLIPCWMASPESVSAIFPMETPFDLIIFDEASQCFVEQGIPAMYRGKQLVIAGDNKQLRPNDLYRVRYDEDIDEDPNLEISSVLELAERHLMNIQLKGHYRSKSLDLIDFSNQKFYNGSLRLLPDLKTVNAGHPAIEYINVSGQWDNNCNEIEADKVVTLLQTYCSEYPEKSIGIVTFNARQQELIMDKMDDWAMQQKIVFPPGIFVKNIENVQGDERDIIIFSTGYGMNAEGKMMMQFGSLNAEFGENRLNVAITRAREKIIIVSSILPQQLKVSEAKNAGPKILREYMEYAVDVAEGRFKPTILNDNTKKPVWFLKSRIIDWARKNLQEYVIAEEMPFSDLTVKKENLFVCLIITDDDIYHQSTSAKDFHVYTPLNLQSKHWKIFYINSRQFWHDKEVVFEALIKFIKKNSEDFETAGSSPV